LVRRDEGRRQVALDTIRETYAEYERSEYARRWSEADRGIRYAVAERDSWLTDALIGGEECVVDIGCGDGNVALSLLRAGKAPARYVGIDLVADRVAAASARVPYGEFLVGSGDELSLEDASADAVVAFTLFSSILDDDLLNGIAAEINRVLRPGGRVLVYDLRYPNPFNRRIRPVTLSLLKHLFPAWSLRSTTMTLLPPLARTVLASGRRRYGALASIPLLRSHRGSLLVKP
jgi:ubiquinone/menaquinone biosynthesis C-methylase UbiE